MARRDVGESVRWYEDPNGERRWLWFCTDCRSSGRDLPTREAARMKREKHEPGCLGYEPEWLREARGQYARELDASRRRGPAYRSPSRAVRMAAWDEQHERDRRAMGGSDAS